MDDRFLKLPNLCQEIILRELILKNDARNIRRAYEKDTQFQRTFELTWTRTLESLKVSFLPLGQLKIHGPSFADALCTDPYGVMQFDKISFRV